MIIRSWLLAPVTRRLDSISQMLLIHHKEISMTQADVAQRLRDLKAQNEKARTEQAEAFKKLQDELANAVSQGEVTPELQAAVDELGTSIQADDDQFPDAAAPAPAPAPDDGSTPTT